MTKLCRLIFLFAWIAIISCSSNDGNNNSVNETESFAVKNTTEASFTIADEDSKYDCNDGELAIEKLDVIINYSIKDNILTWEAGYSTYEHSDGEWYDIGMKFDGKSNSLAGVWTRKLNSTNCHNWFCGRFEDAIKLEFMENTSELKITYGRKISCPYISDSAREQACKEAYETNRDFYEVWDPITAKCLPYLFP